MVRKLREATRIIHECTERRTAWQEADALVSQINRKLVGWANYFSLGPVSKAYGAIDQYTMYRLRRWLRAKHKVKNTGKSRYSIEYLHDKLGLVWLCQRTRIFPWATA
jgi:RNA-directed DNA polymerase